MPSSLAVAPPPEPTHAPGPGTASSSPDPQSAARERPRRTRNWPAWIAGITCLVVGFSGGMAIGTSTGEDGGTPVSASDDAEDPAEHAVMSPVSAALDSCGVDPSDAGVIVMDGGASVELDADYGLGDVYPGDVECVLEELGAPESVYARMGRTRALDGTQTAEWASYTASWTYHPDDGLNVIVVGGSDA